MARIKSLPRFGVSPDDQVEYTQQLVKATQREAVVAPILKEGVEIGWAPQKGCQEEAFSCPAFEVLAEGPRGGGKTDWLIFSFASCVGRGYGNAWRGVIFRQSYPQLADVVAKTAKWFPQIWGGDVKFNEQKMTWRWKSGEVLMLRHMRRPSDYNNFHGHELPFIGFEELTQWPDDACYKLMISCCRSSKPGLPRMLRSTTNPYGCVPYGEVLTETGWRDIKTIEAGDRVVSFDRKGKSRLSMVERRTERWHSGDMIKRIGKGLHMEFTPNHRFPSVGGHRDGTNSLIAFNDLPSRANILAATTGWKGGKTLETFTVPEKWRRKKRKLKQPLTLSGKNYAEFMGWFLSEGYVHPTQNRITISQERKEHRPTIETLLNRCGFSFRKDKKGFYFNSWEWKQYLRQFGKSADKFVPREILGAEEEILRAFLDAAVDGDGHRRNASRFNYFSVSKQLRDDVAEASVKLGYRVSYADYPIKDSKSIYYGLHASVFRLAINLRTGNHIANVKTTDKSVNVTCEHFEGNVYCLTVPGDESFIIRQGKNVWLSGNSGHGWVKERFKLTQSRSRIFYDEQGNTRCPIYFPLTDNKLLMAADPNYLQKVLAAARNDAEREAWVSGSWDIVAGGMFDEAWFKASKYIVIPAFDPKLIPESWVINRSYDHGESKPFSVGWWAQSDGTEFYIEKEDRVIRSIPGDIFRFKEWYGKRKGRPNEGLRLPSSEIAKGIIEQEIACGIYGIVNKGPADDQIFYDQDGNCIAKNMAKSVFINGRRYSGVKWKKAGKKPNSRISGWDALRQMMLNTIPSADGVREYPGIFVSDCCEDFIRTIPKLTRSDLKPDDVDTDDEDHIADEVRYRIMNKPKIMKREGFYGT